MLLHNSKSMSLYNQRSIFEVSGTVMILRKIKIKLFIRKFVTIFFLNSVF